MNLLILCSNFSVISDSISSNSKESKERIEAQVGSSARDAERNYNITITYMTYIKLEDVLRNIKWHNADWILEHLIEDINSLPSINPEEMIKTMVDEKLNMMQDNPYFHPEMWIDFLEELLQKFKS